MDPSNSTLFPSVHAMTGSSPSISHVPDSRGTTLFAAAQGTQPVDEVLSSAKSNMSWLNNTSFDPSHAELVLQRENMKENDEAKSPTTVAPAKERIVAQDEIRKDTKKKKKYKKRSSRSRSRSRSRDRHARSHRRRSKSRSRSRDRRRSRSRERKRHRSRSGSRERKRTKKKKTKHKRKAHRSSDSSDHSPSRRSSSPPRAIFTDDLPDLAPEYRYRVDRRPDRDNLTYASLYKMNVARYWRLGNVCLGSPLERPVFVKDSQAHKMEKSAFSKRLYISDLGEKVFATAAITTDDFLIVNEPDKEASEVNPLGVYDDKTEQWLQGKGGLDLGPEPAVNVKTAIDLEIEEYNKYLREYPRDVDKWLQFVKYQDEFLKSNRRVKEGASEDMESRKVSDHLVIQKKLAILEKALKTNSGNVVLETLRLELSRSVLEPEQLRTEWRQFVLAHLDDPMIWRSFITYHQCDLTRFTVRDTLAVYGKCLATFNKLRTREMRDWVVPLDVEYQMLDIFCRLCRFLRQTGYTERAVAAYQALIEFNLRPPASVSSHSTDHEIKLAVFEPYWDAAVPRLGEEAAPGWAQWVKEKDDVFTGSPEDEDDDHLLKDETQRKASIWLRLETRRERMAWLPWRPDLHKGQGQEDMADFDRVVLFDDIAAFLFTLKEPAARLRLLSEFLNFLGVEIPRSSRSLLGVGDCQTGLEWSDHVTNHVERHEDQEFVMRILENYSELTSSDSNLNALDVVTMDYLTSRVKSTGQVKPLKKFAKRILQKEQNRNRHDLWLKFAEIERLSGNTESCIKVLQTVLCQTSDGAISPNVHKYYIKILLGIASEREDIFSKRTIAESDKNDVINLCSCLAQSSVYDPSRKLSSPIIQLKTRRDFVDKHSKLEKALFWTMVKEDRPDDFRSKLSDYLANVYCFATFQLLTVGHDQCDELLTETDRLLNNGFRTVSQRENFDDLHLLYESFHEDRIQITALSVVLGSRPLSVLRGVVTTALDTFPDSDRFIRWLARLEARSSFAGRWRRYVDEKAGTGATAKLWVAAVESELAKMGSNGTDTTGSVEVPRTGLVYRIRALLERATASDTGRTSILIWRMYMKFEFKNGDLDRAKTIFYKALQQCPWAKSLYLDAVEYFPADLEEITDLMLEKGLRLRCIPEELDIVVE